VTGARFSTSRGFTNEQLYSTASYQAKDLVHSMKSPYSTSLSNGSDLSVGDPLGPQLFSGTRNT
jgi:hypothetical protein